MSELATHPLNAWNVIVNAFDRLRKRTPGWEIIELPAIAERVVQHAEAGAGLGRMSYANAFCLPAPDGTRRAFAVGIRLGGTLDLPYEYDIAVVPVRTPVGAPEDELVAEIVRGLADERTPAHILRANTDESLSFNGDHPLGFNLDGALPAAIGAEQANLEAGTGGHKYRYTPEVPEMLFEGMRRLLQIPLR